ncbi:primase-helicase family protein [Gracilimonas tropica]|uniref:primase-helicase family protein n=1 Tax=Gracilimonas tropica TaxID=454600 RepID=UPI0003612E7B|nr:DUF5906 domain-containing protein [Gracilimonas tropica]
MSYKIIDTLRCLGVKIQEKDANEEGWLLTNAVYRKDVHPSMGVNLNNGSYVDFAGKAPGGSIIDLVVLTKNCSRQEAYEFVNSKGSSKGIALPKTDSFWTDEKKEWLKECQQMLKTSPSADVVQKAKHADALEFEILVKFNCGLTNRYIDGENQQVIVFPYETGVQYYTRNKTGKLISMEKGSKPKESFFGKELVAGRKKLIIAKSPRETMLYYQTLGDSYDVIGIASGEVANLSELQRINLKYLLQRVSKVFVSFDRDTNEAEKIAFGFARAVRDIDNNYGLDVELLNISGITGGKCKDFTDFIKCNAKGKLDQLFSPGFENSDYIWNSTAKENKIWHSNLKGKVSISQVGLAQQLKKNGFGKIYYKESSEPIMVRKVENILSQPSNNQLNDFIRTNWIKKYSKIVDCVETDKGQKYLYASQVEDKYFSYDYKILNPNYVAKLDILNVNFMKDTKDTSYLYYSDKVVKITKNTVEEMEYSDLSGVIWENQIIDRPFTYQNRSSEKSEFATFVSNISGGNPKRIKSLESHIGYYLHAYKHPARTKAAIFTDEKMGPKGSANGGTGKSLVGRAIQRMRKVTFIGGKQFDPSSRFAFMDVEIGDQLVIIDDVKEDFKFEALFTVITNDMNIEAKGADRYTIPFEYSPKFLITSNTPIAGSGNSHKRRQSIVEFADYYSLNFTPEHDFGHSLFYDWDKEEWNKFDNYMIHCLQMYLSEGLVTYSINYDRKQFGMNTATEFVQWAEANLEAEIEYDLRELFKGSNMFPDSNEENSLLDNDNDQAVASFYKSYPHVLDYNQARTFNNWIEQFGEFKGWKPHRRSSNGRELIIYKEK